MKGFTLIELIIAVALSLVTVMAVSEGYRQVLSVQNRYMEKRVVDYNHLLFIMQKQLTGVIDFNYTGNTIEYTTSMGLTYPYVRVVINIQGDKAVYREYKNGIEVYRKEFSMRDSRMEVSGKDIVKLYSGKKVYYLVAMHRQRPVGYFRKF